MYFNIIYVIFYHIYICIHFVNYISNNTVIIASIISYLHNNIVQQRIVYKDNQSMCCMDIRCPQLPFCPRWDT